MTFEIRDQRHRSCDYSTGNDLSHLPPSLPRFARPSRRSRPRRRQLQNSTAASKGFRTSLARLHFNFSWMPCPTLLAHSERQTGGRNYAAPRRAGPPSVTLCIPGFPRRQAEAKKRSPTAFPSTSPFSPSLSHRKNLRNFPATDAAAAAPTEHGDNHGR